MQISVSETGKLTASRRKLATLTAVLSVCLIMALGAEVSHAHDSYEDEFNCEICLHFSDELVVANCHTDQIQPAVEYSFPLYLSLPESQTIQANSRGPPQD